MVGGLPANAGDTGSSPGLGGSHNDFLIFCLFPLIRSLCLSFFFHLFIYFWCVGSLLLHTGFLYSSLLCVGCSLRWLLLLGSTGSRRVGFSSCGTWAQQLWFVGSRVQAQ